VRRDDDLHLAAVVGDLDKVRQLVAEGFDINAFDEFGKTALHYAVDEEHLEVARLLIRSGADVNARSEQMIGDTPLAAAAGTCSLEMAKLLVEAGADPTIRGWMQLNALDRAGDRKQGDGLLVYELLVRRTNDLAPDV
jgi:ankyrin repeat protein